MISPRIEWSIVTRFTVPLAVIVVAHHVDVVKVLVQLRDVVGHVNGGGSGTDGCRQDVVVLVEGRAEVLNQSDEVLLVLWLATALTLKKSCLNLSGQCRDGLVVNVFTLKSNNLSLNLRNIGTNHSS